MTPPNAPERRSLSSISLARAFSVFLLLAALCSIPRFGQRENEYFPAVSDSDLYLEMARVFAGQAQGFTAEWVASQPHHYNRPCFRFLPGCSAGMFSAAIFGQPLVLSTF